MSRSINSAVFSGNLVRNPEARYTNSGTAIVSFSVAINEREKVNGEWTDRPSFVDVTVFGKSGEACAQHLHQGSQVFVKGKLRQDRWQDQNGNNRSALKVVADDVVFAGSSPQQGGQPQQQYQQAPVQQAPIQQAPPPQQYQPQPMRQGPPPVPIQQQLGQVAVPQAQGPPVQAAPVQQAPPSQAPPPPQAPVQRPAPASLDDTPENQQWCICQNGNKHADCPIATHAIPF
jgi:single-strand DNA-binding protein